jgi:hypothetical protein
MPKFHVKLPGLKYEGQSESPAAIFVAMVTLIALWAAIFFVMFYVGFLVLNWALGIFGYHITGWQYIGGWVILGFLRTVISYLFHRE